MSTHRPVFLYIICLSISLLSGCILSTAQAQDRTGRRLERGRSSLSSEHAAETLPKWARPQSSTFSRRPNREKKHETDPSVGLAPGTGTAETKGMGTPDDPSKAPLDGLEWLLLLGAGYGIWRMKYV